MNTTMTYASVWPVRQLVNERSLERLEIRKACMLQPVTNRSSAFAMKVTEKWLVRLMFMSRAAIMESMGNMMF